MELRGESAKKVCVRASNVNGGYAQVSISLDQSLPGARQRARATKRQMWIAQHGVIDGPRSLAM